MRNSSSTISIKQKKRKQTKAKVMEDALVKVTNAITKGSKESDRMHLVLEDKITKYEDQQRLQQQEF